MTTSAPAQPVVIKIGGTAHEASAAAAPLWDAVARLSTRASAGSGGAIVVHGGKDAIDRQLALANKPVARIAGLRVTPPDQIEHVEAALAGVVNGAIVRALNARGARAVGLTLCDGNNIRAERLRVDGGDLGHVGIVRSGSPDLLRALLDAGYLPVIASIGQGPDHEPLNVNADDAAAAIAGIIRARALVLLTGVPGVLDTSGAPIPRITAADADAMIASGAIADGMIPKIRAALDAARTARCPVTIGGWATDTERRALAAGEPFGTVIEAPPVKPRAAAPEQGVLS